MAKILGKTMQDTGYGLMGLTVRATPMDDDAAIACMETAYEQGINLWNGGEFYGSVERNSLQILNKYFTKHPDQVDKITISIKGSNKPGTYDTDGSPQNVRRSIDECLRVLDGKKFLDIFEAARVDPTLPIENTIETIAEYVKAGKVGGISLSECSAESIRRASKVHKIECVETGQLKSPDNIPDNDFRKYLPRFQPGTFEKNLELVREIEMIAQKKGVTPGQISMAWVVKQSSKPGMPTIIPIPGSASPARIKENTFIPSLTNEEVAEVDKVVESAEIVGNRYMGQVEDLNFGDSPALEK